MIVAFVVFGLVCIIGAFIVCLLMGMSSGNLIGVEINKRKSLKSDVNRIVNGVSVPQQTEKPKEKYFIKLGKNKIPIEKSEVRKAKSDGYEVLIE